jgi:predicted transcriptional regulator
MRNNYNFYETIILETRCVLVEVLDGKPDIYQLLKHIRQIEKVTDNQIVLLYKNITRYRRRSLIENRIAFVIEDGQMFLPFLGIDLKKVQENIETEVKAFTPSAQIAYLYFLYHKETVLNTTEFANIIGFNEMKASRALNELYQANLVNYQIVGKTGRSKEYKRISDPEYFKIGLNYLKTPVKKVIFTKTKPVGALVAGFDALASLSMINQSDHSIMAIDINKLNNEEINIIKNKDRIKDEKLIELQLWSYEPKHFNLNGYISHPSIKMPVAI